MERREADIDPYLHQSLTAVGKNRKNNGFNATLSTLLMIISIMAGIALASFFSVSCSTQRKLTYIQQNPVAATLSLPYESRMPELDSTVKAPHKDTLKFEDFDGREVIIMNAIKDENGDMVATDVIDAAVVTARFRNVAERHGKVDIEFQVKVPAHMQDSRWQLRFHPRMYIMEDTLKLDDVIITGNEYRKAQLRGYQHYEKFINSIITDSTMFINRWQLELFIERNIPALYAFKADTSFVSDELFASVYGVTEKEAVEHYTNDIAKRYNERKKSRKEAMFRRYVKAPIVTEGIRLDTVIVDGNGDFVYNYVQTINTRPKLRKVDIVLDGDIYEQEAHLYTIPQSEPLTFYISSLSAFVDNTERYMTKVIERRVEANTACYIDFELGKADIREDLGYNRDEIGRIKQNLRDLVSNEKFDLDSLTISAYASPEGSVRANSELSLKRARSASAYFSNYVKELRDSLNRESGFQILFDGSAEQEIRRSEDSQADIRFISHSGGENWQMLSRLVSEDEELSDEQKEEYGRLCEEHRDLDSRERAMSRNSSYKHLREVLYPRLRIVKFDFYLHRKGMVKDTVHTTVLDSTYMAGVQAIRDRDYEAAITLLRPYNDYNTAIAYCSMDYNASALAILENIEKTPQVNYMLAVLYSRRGDDESAVKHYMKACQDEPTYIHRGNLDPEISALIKRYDLLKAIQPEEDNFPTL